MFGASLEQSLEFNVFFALLVEVLYPAAGARVFVLLPEAPQRASGAVGVQASEVSVPSLQIADMCGRGTVGITSLGGVVG